MQKRRRPVNDLSPETAIPDPGLITSLRIARHFAFLMMFPLFVLLGWPAVSFSRAQASSKPLMAGFISETASVNGIKLHYVRGGKGPAVILIHGFPQDWFEYHAIMPRLAKRFTVIAIDLPGVGGSTAKPGGYDAASMAEDIYQLASALKLDQLYVVGHDIGGMVAYAFDRRYPQILRGVMILDVVLPGVAGSEEIRGDPILWHVYFMQVPGLAEKLVSGRQADYFHYFFQFGKFTPSDVAHFVNAYAATSQLHSAFEMYRAFPANAQFNAAQLSPNHVPLFFGTGEHSPFAKLRLKVADGLRANGCTHVDTGLIPDSIHYVVEDNPDAVASLIEQHASPKRHSTAPVAQR
jgi:pimeloyl-ACP methyl ester carboxylesterase